MGGINRNPDIDLKGQAETSSKITAQPETSSVAGVKAYIEAELEAGVNVSVTERLEDGKKIITIASGDLDSITAKEVEDLLQAYVKKTYLTQNYPTRDEIADIGRYRGFWQEGVQYIATDIVTHSDQNWYCLADTMDEPPSNAWQLQSTAGATGKDGEDGVDGTDGYSVFLSYHDNDLSNEPAKPTGAGNTGGWHTAVTADSKWMSTKIAQNISAEAWGTPVYLKGAPGDAGQDGSEVYYEYQYSTAGTGSWHSDFLPTDYFRRERLVTVIGNTITYGEWTTGVRMRQDGDDGYTPVKGVDYFDGKDGSFVSYVYYLSNLPITPVNGSFDGTTEVMPHTSGDAGDLWNDNPVYSGTILTQVSSCRYSKNDSGVWVRTTPWSQSIQYNGKDGNTINTEFWFSTTGVGNPTTDPGEWDASQGGLSEYMISRVLTEGEGGPWSSVTRIKGNDGTSFTVKGSDTLVNIEAKVNPEVGDVWISTTAGTITGSGEVVDIRDGLMWTDAGVWDNIGPIAGQDGVDGKSGLYISYVYKTTSNITAPSTPTGGSYSGTTETFPTGWVDNPIFTSGNLTWVSMNKYQANPDGTWSQIGSWSTPAKWADTGNYIEVRYKKTLDTDPVPTKPTVAEPVDWDIYPPTFDATTEIIWATSVEKYSTGELVGDWTNVTQWSGHKGDDGIDGKTGIYTSYVYRNTNVLAPNGTPIVLGAPTDSGSFDGTTEVPPTDWSDNPSYEEDKLTWMSKGQYEETSPGVWSLKGVWSDPVRWNNTGIYYETRYSVNEVRPDIPVGAEPGDPWFITPPAPSGAQLVWASTCTKHSTGELDTTWSVPQQWAGADGLDGTDGLSVKSLYKASGTEPNAPTGTAINPAGWSEDVPALIMKDVNISGDFVTDENKRVIPSLSPDKESSTDDRVTFYAEAGTNISVYAYVVSEVEYDYFIFGNLNSPITDGGRDSILGDGVSSTIDYTIPTTGVHYIEFRYYKDGSVSAEGETCHYILEDHKDVWAVNAAILDNSVTDWSDVFLFRPAITLTPGNDGADGANGIDGSVIEFRYAQNGSTVVAPTVPANLAGWSTTPPILGAMFSLWRISAKRNADGSLATGWSTSVWETQNATGAIVIDQKGEYSASTTYTGITTMVSVVTYNGSAYFARPDALTGTFTGVVPTNTSYWCPFSASFATMSAGLILAQKALIENLVVRELQTSSDLGGQADPDRMEFNVEDSTALKIIKGNAEKVILSPDGLTPLSDFQPDTTVEFTQLGYISIGINSSDGVTLGGSFILTETAVIQTPEIVATNTPITDTYVLTATLYKSTGGSVSLGSVEGGDYPTTSATLPSAILELSPGTYTIGVSLSWKDVTTSGYTVTVVAQNRDGYIYSIKDKSEITGEGVNILMDVTKFVHVSDEGIVLKWKNSSITLNDSGVTVIDKPTIV